jgi:TIR domain
MADVFLTYKREDRAKIEPLVQLLQREGLTVWWDPALVAGEDFVEVISREVNAARCVLVAWSARSVNALWVQDEAAAGRDRGILVAFSLDGAKPPLGFRGIQTPDLSSWTGDGDDVGVRQLIAGIRRLVADSRQASTPRPPTVDPAWPGNRLESPGSHLFISYARENESKVRQLTRLLEKNQQKVWVDTTGTLGGRDWSDQVIGAIKTARVLVLIISRASMQSKPVQREVRFADKRNIPIVPVLIEARVTLPDWYEFHFGFLHWVDASDRKISERAVAEIIEAVR